MISNIRLGIGIPLNHQTVPAAFFDSFITMQTPPWIYLRSSVGPIEEMRNNLVESALTAGCTHLIMMDTDQIYQPDTVTRLLSHRKPIVGCMICRRYPPFDPLMLKGEVGGYENITEWKDGELVEVDATGTGCLMFETSVFKKIKAPWFKFRKTETGSNIGEDIGFCSVAKRHGYKIYVDTGCKAGHLSNMVVNEATWKLYRKLKDAGKYHNAEHGVLTNKEG
jgi:hypothetical protein